MAEIKIVKEDDAGRGGRYVARIAGIDGEAEITFTRRGADLISADHTGAPETLRGTGAAAALVSFMVEDARRNGFRILPLCPYVRAQYRKNPDWADVMTPAPGEEPDLAKLRTRQAD
jgi:predicted GNAT family acetyltransferase